MAFRFMILFQHLCAHDSFRIFHMSFPERVEHSAGDFFVYRVLLYDIVPEEMWIDQSLLIAVVLHETLSERLL